MFCFFAKKGALVINLYGALAHLKSESLKMKLDGSDSHNQERQINNIMKRDRERKKKLKRNPNKL